MSTEPLSKSDTWNPYFHKKFAGFSSITPILINLNSLYWPTLEEYNALAAWYFEQHMISTQIRFILQKKTMQYESQIYQYRHVPTRLNLWHDFFNNLSWIIFPNIKWAIIKRFCEEQKNKMGKSRTLLQNLLAHFDECGMVICTDSDDIISKIQAFRWKILFCETPNLLTHCLPIVVGHGLMQKGLSPYIGMTGKALFLKVDKTFFTQSTTAQNKHVDEHLARYIESPVFPCDPKQLHPFPLLGWPGWHVEQTATFYENTTYFRSLKRLRNAVLADPENLNRLG